MRNGNYFFRDCVFSYGVFMRQLRLVIAILLIFAGVGLAADCQEGVSFVRWVCKDGYIYGEYIVKDTGFIFQNLAFECVEWHPEPVKCSEDKQGV